MKHKGNLTQNIGLAYKEMAILGILHEIRTFVQACYRISCDITLSYIGLCNRYFIEIKIP